MASEAHIQRMLQASLVARQGVPVKTTATCAEFLAAVRQLCEQTGQLHAPFGAMEFGVSADGNGHLVLETDDWGAVVMQEGRRR